MPVEKLMKINAEVSNLADAKTETDKINPQPMHIPAVSCSGVNDKPKSFKVGIILGLKHILCHYPQPK